MPNIEIELNPVDFVTIDTIGPKGQRVFYLQAGQEGRLVSLVIEKEQSWALSEAIKEMMNDLITREDGSQEALPYVDMGKMDMALREPIQPVFRVAQMGLGYDEEHDLIVLVAQELVTMAELDDSGEDVKPSVVRLWCSREQVLALSQQAMEMVKSGRVDPKQNGRLVNYWT